MASNAKTYPSLPLTLLVGILTLGSLSLPPLALVQRADRMLFDLWSRVAPPSAPDEIVIVNLDDTTPYQTLARIADEQGARLLISTLAQPSTDDVDTGALGPTATAPVGSPLLHATAWTRGGYLWLEPDLDGVIRHERPLISDRAPVPSLALAGSIALQRAAQSEMPGYEVIAYSKPLDVDEKGRRWLRYFDHASFRILTPAEILETPTELADKIVIAGQDTDEAHVTPVGELNTQELLAHELAGYWLSTSVTTGTGNYAIGWGLTALLLLIVAALPLSLTWITALPMLGAGALLVGSAGAFVTEGNWYPIAGPLLIALLGGSYGAWILRQRPKAEPDSSLGPPDLLAARRLVARGSGAEAWRLYKELRLSNAELKELYELGRTLDLDGEQTIAQDIYHRITSIDPRYQDVGDRLTAAEKGNDRPRSTAESPPPAAESPPPAAESRSATRRGQISSLARSLRAAEEARARRNGPGLSRARPEDQSYGRDQNDRPGERIRARGYRRST